MDHNQSPEPYMHPTVLVYACSHCSKHYSTPHHLETHHRTCNLTKRNVESLLEETKLFWENRKRCKITKPGPDPGVVVPLLPEPDADDLEAPVAQRRPRRTIKLPLRYTQDAAPESTLVQFDSDVPNGEPEHNHPAVIRPDMFPFFLRASVAPSSPPPRANPPPRQMLTYTSNQDVFGISRTYRVPAGTPPTHDPDHLLTLWDLAREALQTPQAQEPAFHEGANLPSFGPFLSRSAFSLAEWYWNSTHKSFSDFQKLVSIFKEPEFSLSDATRVNWKAAFHSLGADPEAQDGEAWLPQDDGWKCTPVVIDVPFHKQMKDPGIGEYSAGLFRHRSIVSVIKEKLKDSTTGPSFHYYPYQERWKPGGHDSDVELYGELFTSPVFHDAHEKVQMQPTTEQNAGMERVVVALMFWSDATQLTSFGTAALWPCYLFFGNESKYRRCQPSERLGQHVAYFLKLPSDFNDYLRARNGGKLPTEAVFKYCARDLFHKQWAILLDRELQDAMKNGLVIQCPDGKERCFYPRIFTYSADYPEKILIAGIRFNGKCPCHRCLCGKCDFYLLGTPEDARRRVESQRDEGEALLKGLQATKIIKRGLAVDGTAMEEILKPQSLVPIKNTIATILSDFGIGLIPLLVVDILHEFEIGVWKRLFIHLIRLLNAFSPRRKTGTTNLAAELDVRYRNVPSFGRDTIRKFGVNASEMRRKAARDYEDLLQCAIPVFESLLPEPHNSVLMTLLYLCAQWHSLAKLRQHNEFTLDLLDYTTTRLGAQMRSFDRETCSTTPTVELAREADARARRDGKKGGTSASATRRPVALDIYTIKFHYLGDYVSTIRAYGTCDSYSTETGELYHRMPKSWFGRTSRGDYEAQMASIERRQARLSVLRAGIDASMDQQAANSKSSFPGSVSPQPSSDSTSPNPSYSIGVTENRPVFLSQFLPALSRSDSGVSYQCQADYAVDFIQKMKQHLLPRVASQMGIHRSQVNEQSWTKVSLQHDRIYSHQLMRLNYSTYDVRRDEDVVHIGTTQCNLMLLNTNHDPNPPNPAAGSSSSPEVADSGHLYRYCRALGIFHANVSLHGFGPEDNRATPAFHRIYFVWVHWYEFSSLGVELTLDSLRLRPLASRSALGFVDPADIIRGVHLIPRFSMGKRLTLNAGCDEEGKESGMVFQQEPWKEYIINKFVDRDMFMRYQYGMSPGHTYMHSVRPSIPSIPPDFDHHLSPPTFPLDVVDDDDENPYEGEPEDVDSGGYSDHLNDLSDTEVTARHEMYGVDGI